jgi:hypothetical protein
MLQFGCIHPAGSRLSGARKALHVEIDSNLLDFEHQVARCAMLYAARKT